MMTARILGIDCGGTHTDAALLEVVGGQARLLAAAKTVTRHDNLVGSLEEVLRSLQASLSDASWNGVERVTLGTTLEVNALTQDKADKVGLALVAGPGLNPEHFALGEHVCIVPGGLDHRGLEVTRLDVGPLEKAAPGWPAQGVAAIACVGKFSPRNPAQEDRLGDIASKLTGLPVTLGHKLSGRLNFPRRIATAYYNAAVASLHNSFLDAAEQTFRKFGLNCQYRLLKADGGAVPFEISRREPVQSILSGPAASVMGVQALWEGANQDCSLLLDIGGTTTDIAVFIDGSPVVDRQGMVIRGRRTLVRSLATISIGVGGDSLISMRDGEIGTGPLRDGPAMAFGGDRPTLMDALNVLDEDNLDRGDVEKSRAGIDALASECGLGSGELAARAVEDAMNQIARAARDLVELINSRPIYTITALKALKKVQPRAACLVGGPALCLRTRVAGALGIPVEIAPHSQVANAIGAALTLPTASLELYADTGKREAYVPRLNFKTPVKASATLDDMKALAVKLLDERLRDDRMEDTRVEVVEADLFATLDDYGRGSKDMRVVCQAVPGILAQVR